MARKSDWLPEEDAILLRTRRWKAPEVNAELAAAGFRARSGEQIKQRRDYITDNPGATAAASVGGTLPPVLVRLDKLHKRLERCRAECAQVPQLEAEIAEAVAELGQLYPPRAGEAAG